MKEIRIAWLAALVALVSLITACGALDDGPSDGVNRGEKICEKPDGTEVWARVPAADVLSRATEIGLIAKVEAGEDVIADAGFTAEIRRDIKRIRSEKPDLDAKTINLYLLALTYCSDGVSKEKYQELSERFLVGPPSDPGLLLAPDGATVTQLSLSLARRGSTAKSVGSGSGSARSARVSVSYTAPDGSRQQLADRKEVSFDLSSGNQWIALPESIRMLGTDSLFEEHRFEVRVENVVVAQVDDFGSGHVDFAFQPALALAAPVERTIVIQRPGHGAVDIAVRIEVEQESLFALSSDAGARRANGLVAASSPTEAPAQDRPTSLGGRLTVTIDSIKKWGGRTYPGTTELWVRVGTPEATRKKIASYRIEGDSPKAGHEVSLTLDEFEVIRLSEVVLEWRAHEDVHEDLVYSSECELVSQSIAKSLGEESLRGVISSGTCDLALGKAYGDTIAYSVSFESN